jgi:hypothetical protein
MKINTILPFLIPVIIAGGLITYNEMNDNVLLEMLNTINVNSQIQNTTESDTIEIEQNQETISVLEQTNTETNEIPPTKTNTVTQENTEADNANKIIQIEVPQANNSEFITELIESQATTAQKSYNCGSKGCFETAFKNCTSAIGIDEVLKPYSQKTQYEIIEMGETGCKVKTTFEISFFQDW